MVKLKKLSKRQPLARRYHIEKKAKAHHKKMKKLAKNNKQLQKRKSEKLHIPNSCPFKLQLLKEIQRKKESNLQSADATQSDSSMLQNSLAFSNLVDAVEQRTDQFDKDILLKEKSENQSTAQSQKDSSSHFYKDLQKVIDLSDVLIEVLDARDPNSCRCLSVENKIVAANKKVVLLLNKIDLVPKSCVEAWLRYFRRELPVIAFKCAQESSRVFHSTASLENASAGLLDNESQVIGAQTLLKLIKNYSRTGNSKVRCTVGIIGYPNVGKSSVINSLKRSQVAVKTGGEPGVTRNIQEIQLDSGVFLIDSPGVVMNSNPDPFSAMMLHSIKFVPSKAEAFIEWLVDRCAKSALMQLFYIPDFNDANEFLVNVATSRGKLLSKGLPDTAAAARIILNEFSKGKICFYTHPPALAFDDESNVSLTAQNGESLDLTSIFASQLQELSGFNNTVEGSVALRVDVDSNSNNKPYSQICIDVQKSLRAPTNNSLRSKQGAFKNKAMFHGVDEFTVNDEQDVEMMAA